MRRFSGACRYVFNRALVLQQNRYERGEQKHLDYAYRNFFEKRAQFPRFRKKGRRDSFRFPQGTKLDQPRLIRPPPPSASTWV
jgi:putative transposase